MPNLVSRHSDRPERTLGVKVTTYKFALAFIPLLPKVYGGQFLVFVTGVHASQWTAIGLLCLFYPVARQSVRPLPACFFSLFTTVCVVFHLAKTYCGVAPGV